MTVNALDNGYTDRSPCLDDCPYANDDKKDCIDRCGRLEAYRNGQPYKHIPRLVKGEPAASETVEKAFPVKSPTPKPVPWQKAMPKKKKQAEKLAKPAKIALPKVVAVPAVKQKIEGSEVDRLEAALEKSGGKCLICLDRTAIRRGLCIRCYCRWQGSEKNGKAKVLHPIFGKFKKMTLDELSASRHKNYTDCLMPDCQELGERRGLCVKCYKFWHRKKIEHPIFGIFEPKNKKASMDKAEKKIVVGELEKRKIIIDLSDYEKLYAELKQRADKSFVPISHLIINLIAAGLKDHYGKD